MSSRSVVVRGQGQRPLLVYIAGLVFLTLGISGLAFLSLMFLEALTDPIGSRFGALGIEGLSPEEFLAVSPVVALLVISHAILGYGLLRHRAWSRPLGTFMWFGVGAIVGVGRMLGGAGVESFGYSLLWGIAASALAYWYFYGRRTVRAYYDRLG